MSQMSRNLSPSRAEPVNRGLPTFSSLLFSSLLLSSLYCHLGEKLSLKKRHQTVPRRPEMQSERKEKEVKAKGKLQSDIQCTFY